MEAPGRPGSRVAHYQIVAEIGRGGMGVIFRARDARLGRDVALKCPWPHLASNPTVRERFLREARSASQLSHPHVVPIFEIFKWGGLPWLAMELVEGCSLRTLLQDQGALPLRRVLASAEGLADALRAAHAKGIIHRDINPNNILVRADGWVLLTDFGLAYVLAAGHADPSETTATEHLTKSGAVMGTRGYMSPEQVLGKTLDPRSDIFSLGAVLYEMCTGRRAFEDDEERSANEAIVRLEPAAMSTIDPSVPRELERIVGKALAKRREERHSDARELLADVVALRREVESADYTPPSRPMRLPARRTATAGVVGVVVLGLLILGGVWVRSLVRAPAPFTGGVSRQVTSDPGVEAEPAISPDGGLIAFTSMESDHSEIWITDVKGGSRLRLTDDHAMNRSPTWFPDGAALAYVSDRGGESAVWKVPRLGGTAQLLLPKGESPAVSPDGRRLAFSRANAAGHYRIGVAPLDNPSQVAWLTGDDDGERDHIEPAWSPDGRTICYNDARNLWLVGLDGARARRLTSENAIDTEAVWSSDGLFVVFASDREGTRALWRIAAEGGSPERLTTGTGPETHPSLSSDGRKLVYSTYSDDYDVVLVDLASGRKELIKSRLYDAAPSFASDGRALVFASSRRGGRYDLWVQDLTDGKGKGAPRQLTDVTGTINVPAYSPDGNWIAFKRELPDAREIWVVAAHGGVPERFSDGLGKDTHPAWSPDGTELAYVSERGAEMHVWAAPIRDGRRMGPGRQVTSGETGERLPAWSPDGRRIAYGRMTGDGGELWVAPAAGGTPSGPLAKAPQIGRVRWEKHTGRLWFAAVTVGGETQLRRVSPDGGEVVAAARPELFAEAAPPGDFDLSPDGRLLAFTRQETRGDIWLLDNSRRTY